MFDIFVVVLCLLLALMDVLVSLVAASAAKSDVNAEAAQRKQVGGSWYCNR